MKRQNLPPPTVTSSSIRTAHENQTSSSRNGSAERKAGGMLRNLSVSRTRRRLSTVGEEIGFEADGVLRPAAAPSVPVDMRSDTSFGTMVIASLSREGKVPGNPDKINQDRCWALDLQTKAGQRKFMGVADGHGLYGHDVSELIRVQLGDVVAHELNGHASKPKDALTRAHAKMSELLDQSYIETSYSGSTCVSLLLVDRTLYCANVGDSRAVLGSRKNDTWTATPLSIDHKPDMPAEQKRIHAKGGRVAAYRNSSGEPVGPARVWQKYRDLPGLAMSRSFGDKVAAAVGVISEPEISETTVTDDDKVIIIASDGVWEFLSNDEVLEIVSKFYTTRNTKSAVDELCSRAVEKWKSEEDVIDDVTAIVVFL